MSQSLTHAVALDLKRGDTIYSNVIEFTDEEGDTRPAKARVVGRCAPHQYYGFVLRVVPEYAEGNVVELTGASTPCWRTDAEKERSPVRMRRVRAAPVQAEVEPAPTRVRRTRRM